MPLIAAPATNALAIPVATKPATTTVLSTVTNAISIMFALLILLFPINIFDYLTSKYVPPIAAPAMTAVDIPAAIKPPTTIVAKLAVITISIAFDVFIFLPFALILLCVLA